MDEKDWLNYRHAINIEDAIDLLTSPSPGSLTRTVSITKSGLFRLAQTTVCLYGVVIQSCGAWGRILIEDHKRNELFYQPSLFTGSFKLEDPCAHGGLYAWLMNGPGSDATISISWREP